MPHHAVLGGALCPKPRRHQGKRTCWSSSDFSRVTSSTSHSWALQLSGAWGWNRAPREMRPAVSILGANPSFLGPSTRPRTQVLLPATRAPAESCFCPKARPGPPRRRWPSEGHRMSASGDAVDARQGLRPSPALAAAAALPVPQSHPARRRRIQVDAALPLCTCNHTAEGGGARVRPCSFPRGGRAEPLASTRSAGGAGNRAGGPRGRP